MSRHKAAENAVPSDRSRYEDPWDVTRRRLWGARLAAILAAVVMLSASLWAQSAPIPPDDLMEDPRETRIRLSEETLELAEEFLILLEDLEQLTSDYSRYFAKLESRKAREAAGALRTITEKLRSRSYAEELILLQADLQELKQTLDEIQAEYDDHREKVAKMEASQRGLDTEVRGDIGSVYARGQRSDSAERVERRLVSLGQSLERELAVIHDIYADEIVTRLSTDPQLAEQIQLMTLDMVQAAYDSALERAGFARGDQSDVLLYQRAWPEGFASGDLEWLVGLVDDSEVIRLFVANPDAGSELGDVASLPAIPEAPEPPERLEVPEPPYSAYDIDIGTKRRMYTMEKGKTGLAVEEVDSIEVSRGDLPVYVVSPTGNMDISGWSRDWVVITAETDFVSPSAESAEKTAQRSGLHLYTRPEAVYVEKELPNLTDAGTTILQSNMSIRVPESHPLVVSGSFGTITVTGLESGVRVKSSNARVEISEVSGGLEVVNTLGDVSLVDVSGPISVRNGYSPLSVTDCRGQMDLRNEFADLTVRDCTGEAVIENSGMVRVVGFVGDVSIEGSNGPVTVSDHDGSVAVVSRYGSTTIEDVRGDSINVVNERGAVTLDELDGAVRARSSQGSVVAQGIMGSLDIEGQRSTINLRVDAFYEGETLLRNSHGSIKLSLSADSDLRVSVNSYNGNISSRLPFEIGTDGNRQFGDLILGEGSHLVEVKSEGGSVVIDRAN